MLLLLDRLIPHLHLGSDEPEGHMCRLKKTTMLVLAVTLHNIPEGMAVRVVFAGFLAEKSGITLACRRWHFTWNCDSELPGGSDHFPAASE